MLTALLPYFGDLTQIEAAVREYSPIRMDLTLDSALAIFSPWYSGASFLLMTYPTLTHIGLNVLLLLAKTFDSVLKPLLLKVLDRMYIFKDKRNVNILSQLRHAFNWISGLLTAVAVIIGQSN